LSYLRVSQIRALVDAGHVDAAIGERVADRLAVASADVNKPGAGVEREIAYEMVERGCRPLGCVYLRNPPPNVEFRVVKDLKLHEPVLHGCPDALPCVLHSVDVTDFVSVVSGNRDFCNMKSGGVELHYDVGVEIEPEAVAGEGDLPERRRAIGAIAAVHLRHLRPQDQVLHPRQDTVADPFVQRHPTFDCAERINKTAAENRVGSVRIRRQDMWEGLRRVLAVAVQKDDDVEVLLNGVQITQSLVAAVSLIVRRPKDSQRGVLRRPFEFRGDCKSVVGRVVVDDEDFSEAFGYPGRDALENSLYMPLRIVSHDENRDPIFLQHSPGALANVIQMVIHEFLPCLIVKGALNRRRFYPVDEGL
jgi:hypothetical protein